MPEVKKRIVEYDFARVLAIVAVISIHCYAYIGMHQFRPFAQTWHVANIIDSFSVWCVPVFVMLSGALLIKPGFEMAKVGRFYTSKASRIVTPLLIWATIYIAWYAIFQSHRGWLVDLRHGIQQFVAGTPVGGHLYFLLIIAGLYAITPFLSVLLANLGKKMTLGLALGVLVFTIASVITNIWADQGSGRNMFTVFIPYLGYYLLGYVVNQERERIKRWLNGGKLLGLFILIGLLIAGLTYVLRLQNVGDWKYFYGYLSPTVAVQSVITFLCLMKLSDEIARRRIVERWLKRDYSSLIVKLSNVTFGVYFVHMLLILAFWQVFHDFRYSGDYNSIIVSTVTFIVVGPLSFTLAYWYSRMAPKLRDWLSAGINNLRATITSSKMIQDSDTNGEH